MYSVLVVPAFAALALASAQAPPPPVLLTSTMSGVDPVVPTPFPGVDTIEGAIIYDGPPKPGFVGPGGTASVQSNLPQATYTANLPSTNFDNLTGSTITGSITGKTAADGRGVLFTVNFTGFPSESEYGPFVYHIHTLPVPADGNCTASLSHLDPTNRGELYACDTSNPATCQAGDLAGKHGNITGTSFTASYTDLYLSTDPSSPYYFGGKGLVVHSRNSTRLTCANFVQASSGSSSSSSSGVPPSSSTSPTGGTGGTSPPSTTSSSPPLYTQNVASGLDVKIYSLVGGMVALFAALLM